MNEQRDQHEKAAIDPRVVAHYELLADEATPPELDRIVLKMASSGARTRRRQYSFTPWLRPAAFVATAGLSFALILDLIETGIVAPPTIILPEVQQPSAAPPVVAPAADATTRKRTAAETASALRQEKSLATVASKMAAPEVMGNADGEGSGQCNDQQKSAVTTWWQCVVSLRQAGMNDIAESELLSLQEEYPYFVAPE